MFSNRLKELRKEHSFSAKRLAQKLGCSTNIIYDWEHGRCEPCFDILRKLSNIFSVSIDYLLGKIDEWGDIISFMPDSQKNSLSEQEKELLEYFDRLGPFERDSILVQVKALAGRVKETLPK